MSLKLLGFVAEEGGGGVHHHLKCNLALLSGFAPPFELPLSPSFEVLKRPPFEADMWPEIGGIASPLSSVLPCFLYAVVWERLAFLSYQYLSQQFNCCEGIHWC